jgi:N-acylneuraminate cytidylyltransferase
MKTLVIIPARGGSKRIPRKNIKNFLGEPIISKVIKTVLAANISDEIMVSTDDPAIADISKKSGAKIPFMRSAITANDTATTSDVISEVLQNYKEKNIHFDLICCIYPTAVLSTATHLINAKSMLLSQAETDGVITLCPFESSIFRSFKIEQNKAQMNWPEHEFTRSQDLAESYRDAGQFYFFKTKSFLTQNKVLMKNLSPLVLNKLEAQDIDDLADWQLAEMKYQRIHGTSS